MRRSGHEKAQCQLREFVVLLFVSLLIVMPNAHWAVPLFGLLAVVPCATLLTLLPDHQRHPRRLPAPLDVNDVLCILVLLAYGALWCLDIFLINRNQSLRMFFSPLIPLPVWPMLAAVFLVWLLRYPPSPRAFWVAVCAGAAGAGSIALYERLVLGKLRASNSLNAIPFGNLSLLLGALSLLALLWCLRRGRARSPAMAGIALLAGLLGLLGSLLSGTRGGWIALLFLLVIWFRASQGLFPARWRHCLAGLVALTIVGTALLPASNVAPRLQVAVGEAQDYLAGDPRGSVGLRLEMWRAGLLLWREKPITGWGEGGAMSRRISELIADGRLTPDIRRFSQLHSDIIDTAARRGVLGLAALLMLYGVPLWHFWKRSRMPHCPEVRLMAGAGMMVGVAYIDFGLSQSMLRDPVGLSGYLGLCTACWVAMRTHEASQGQPFVRRYDRGLSGESS